MTPDLFTQLAATGCALALAWHCWRTERAYLLQTHWRSDAALVPSLRRAAAIAVCCTVAVVGAIWL